MIVFSDLVAYRWRAARAAAPAPETAPAAEDGIEWVKARDVREAPHLDPTVFGYGPAGDVEGGHGWPSKS